MVTISHNNIRNLVSADLLTTAGEPEFLRRKRIKAKDINWDTYYSIILNDFQRLQQHLDNLNEYTNINNMDTLINDVDKAFYNAALTSKVAEQPPTIMQYEFPLPLGDRSVVIDHIDNVNKIKQFEMWRNILYCRDSKALWLCINWNGTSETITDTPDIDDLKDHFKDKGNSNEESTLL